MPRYHAPGFQPIEVAIVSSTNPYKMVPTDGIVEFNLSTPAAISVIGPNNMMPIGKIYTIKDGAGNAGTYNITFTPLAGTGTIDGATSATIATNYGSLSFYFDGANLKTVNTSSGSSGGGGFISAARSISSGSSDLATTSDGYIGWNSTSASPKTETIPTSIGSKQVLIIKDEAYTASSDFPINISALSGNIDIYSTIDIATPGGSVMLLDTTNGWKIIA